MIFNRIFSINKDHLKIYKGHIKQYAHTLADLNKFPINTFLCNTEINYPLELGKHYSILHDLINSYLSPENSRSILDKILQYDPDLNTYIKGMFRNNFSTINIINYIISSDCKEYYPYFDSYVDLDIKKSKIIKKIPDITYDSNGLVTLDENFLLKRQGIIYNDKYLLYYHPFLRRGYRGNFTEITSSLIKVNSDPKIVLRIALDLFRISIPSYYREIFEADYWRGPKYCITKLSDPNFKGIIVYKRNQNDSILNQSWPIDRTVFNLSNLKPCYKQIEIEEINPYGTIQYSNKYIGQKYAHLLWDIQEECFKHVDCSVNIYTRGDHQERIKYDWMIDSNNIQIKARKIKLFRLDGQIFHETSVGIISDFFRMNDLIHEFFSGK